MLDTIRPALARHPDPVIVLSLVSTVLLGTCLAGCTEPTGMTAQVPTRPNVLVFVMDAARVDHFGAYGYERNTTPHIDAFAATATRFTHAISEGSFTFASMSALFTGLPPDRTGLLRAHRLGSELTLLPETARAVGYRSRGYSENPFVTQTFGFDRGFEAFETTLSGSRPPVDLVRARSERGTTVSWAMQHERRACARGRKLIVDSADLGVVGYYDLVADPGEQNPLPPDPEAERLLAEIQTRIREGHASLSRPPAATIDPGVLEQIRALGYVEE